MANEKVKRLHKNLTDKWDGFNVPLEQFENDMKDEEKLSRLHKNLSSKWDGFNVDYETFKLDMGVGGDPEKKPKASSEAQEQSQVTTTTSSSEGQSGQPETPKYDLSKYIPKTTQVNGYYDDQPEQGSPLTSIQKQRIEESKTKATDKEKADLKRAESEKRIYGKSLEEVEQSAAEKKEVYSTSLKEMQEFNNRFSEIKNNYDAVIEDMKSSGQLIVENGELKARDQGALAILSGVERDFKVAKQEYDIASANFKNISNQYQLAEYDKYVRRANEGGIVGTVYNSMIDGIKEGVIGIMGKTAAPIIGALAPSDMKEREGGAFGVAQMAMDIYYKPMAEAQAKAVKLNSTTDEYIADLQESFAGKALVGVSKSIPAMIGYQVPVMMLGQGFYAADEMLKDADLTPAEKAGVGTVIGVSSTMFEKMGLDMMFGSGASKAAAKNFIEASAKQGIKITPQSAIAFGDELIRRSAGEGLTGGAQSLSEDAIKSIVNAVKDREVLEVGNWVDVAERFIESSALEAAGGLMMTAPIMVVQNSLSANSSPEVDWNLAKKTIENPNYVNDLSELVNSKVEAGEITPEQAQGAIDLAARFTEVASKIDPTLSNENQQKAFDLIIERDKLVSETEGLEVINPAKKQRIDELNEQIKNFGQPTEQPTEASTPSPKDMGGVQQEEEVISNKSKFNDVSSRASKKERINENDILGAIDEAYTALEELESIDSDEANLMRELIEDEIQNLENYENTTTTETRKVAEAKTVRTIKKTPRKTIPSREKDFVGKKAKFSDNKGGGQVGIISIVQTPDGKEYYTIETEPQKEVVSAKSDGDKVVRRVIPINGTSNKTILGEVAKVFSGAKVNFDSDNNPTSVTFPQKNGGQVTIQDPNIAKEVQLEQMKTQEYDEQIFEETYIEFIGEEDVEVLKPKNKDAKKQQGGEMRVKSKPQEPKGKSNSNLPKVNEAKLQDREKDQKIKEAAKGISKAIRGAKFTKTIADLNKLQSDPTGLLKVAWDGTLEIVASTIDAGGTVAQAIKNGVDHIKTTEWYNNLSDAGKKKAEGKVRDGIKGSIDEYKSGVRKKKKSISNKAAQATKRIKKGRFYNKSIIVANFLNSLKNLSSIIDDDVLNDIENELNAINRRGVGDINSERINELTARVLAAQPIKEAKKPIEKFKSGLSKIKGRDITDMSKYISFEVDLENALNDLDDALTNEEITEEEYNSYIIELSEISDNKEIDLKKSDSYMALIQSKGNVTRAKTAINKAFESGVISAERKSELESGLNEAKKRFEDERDAFIKESNESSKNFFKSNKAIDIANEFNLSKPQYILIDKMFDAFKRTDVFVNDLALADKLAKLADAMEGGYFPLREINEVYRHALSTKRSDEIASILDVAGKNIKGRSADEIELLLSGNVQGFKTSRLGKAVKESAIIDKYVYAPLLEAIGQSEAAQNDILKEFSKKTNLSWLRTILLTPAAKKRRQKNILLAGVFMNQLTDHSSKDGTMGVMFGNVNDNETKLEVGTVDWLGFILGKEEAINAAVGEINPTTRTSLLNGSLKNEYNDRDVKLLEEIWESLPKKEDGSVDYDEFFDNQDKYVSKETQSLIDASQEAFASGYEYISAAKMIRGERLDEIVAYYKRARVSASDVQIDYNTMNATGNMRVTAGSSINRTTNSVGAIDFNVLNTVIANSVEAPRMFNFEINGGLVNSTLNRAMLKSREKGIVSGIKKDAAASVKFNFDRGSSNFLFGRAMSAQYLRILLDHTRMAFEIASLGVRSLVQVGGINTIKGLPFTDRHKALMNLQELTGLSLLPNTTSQIEKGDSSMGVASRSSVNINKTKGLPTLLRYGMAVPEHIFGSSFAYSIFQDAFKSVTGENFDIKAFKTKEYRAENRQAIVDAMSLAQSEMSTVLTVGSKFSSRRRIKWFPYLKNKKVYISSDSSVGAFINYMSTFVFKEGSAIEEATRFTFDYLTKNGYKLNEGMVTGEVFKSRHYRKAAAVFLAGMTYSYLKNLQYLWEGLDDEDKEEESEKLLAEEYGLIYKNGKFVKFDPQLAIEGAVTMGGDNGLFVTMGRYGQGVRLLTIFGATMMYDLLDDDSKYKENIGNFLRKKFYTKPIGKSLYEKKTFAAENIPIAEMSVSTLQSATDVYMTIKELLDKENLTDDEVVKLKYYLASYRMFNIGLMFRSGVMLPSSRRTERYLEGEIDKMENEVW